MKMKLLASLSAAFIATAVVAGSAQAERCSDYSTCRSTSNIKKVKTVKTVKTVKAMKTVKAVKKLRQTAVRKVSKRKQVRVAYAGRLSGKRVGSRAALAVAAGVPRNRGHVVAVITSMAPRYGVPTWFALRIAKVESNYNPRARGAAGEYGVFQMKCATARGIGFRGNCGALLNTSTNVQYGLKHLALAMRSSRGNLKLAASKHNGGLGRKRLVAGYVSRVF